MDGMNTLPARLISTLADYVPGTEFDALDTDPLYKELTTPSHPGLRAGIAELGILLKTQQDLDYKKIQPLVAATIGVSPELMFLETLRRLPLASALARWEVADGAALADLLEGCFVEARRALFDDTSGVSLVPIDPLLVEQYFAGVVSLYHPFHSPWKQFNLAQVRLLTLEMCRTAVQYESLAMKNEISRLLSYALQQARLLTHFGSGHALQLSEQIVAITGQDRLSAPLLAYAETEPVRRKELKEYVLGLCSPTLLPIFELILEGRNVQSLFYYRSAVSSLARDSVDGVFLRQSRVSLAQDVMIVAKLLEEMETWDVPGWSAIVKPGLFRGRKSSDSYSDAMLKNLIIRSIELNPTFEDAELAVILRQTYQQLRIEPRSLLALAFKMATAQPEGATAVQLRALAASNYTPRYDDQNWLSGRCWKEEIELFFNDLSFEITPPNIEIKRWQDRDILPVHYRTIYDARLQDAPHRALLASVPHAALQHIENSRDPRRATVRDRSGDHTLPVRRVVELEAQSSGHEYLDDWVPPILRTVDCGAAILAQLDAVAPFIDRYPEAAKQLTKLALNLAGKTSPATKWLKQGADALADVPPGDRLNMLASVLKGAAQDRAGVTMSTDALRTAVYLAAAWDPAVVGPLLADAALNHCYQSVPGTGLRDERLGNACLWTLIQMPDGQGIPFLARILNRVKYPKVRAKIDAALNEAAAAAGVTRGALDELTVPTHGLLASRLTLPVGSGTAVLTVAGTTVDQTWVSPDGKPVKAPTAAMKTDTDGVKAAKLVAKEIAADLGAQTARIQRFYVEDRSWPYDIWRDRYRDHPLVGSIVACLIWQVEKDGAATSAILRHQTLEDSDGRAVETGGATIRLWHPVTDAAPAVIAWRDRLEALGIQQPFAQAWREIYLLTDAERATDTYSNRWAGHILKQHQAMTLARLNGWTVTHRICADTSNDQPWHLFLPAHNLVADYWIEGAGGDDPEVLDSGAYMYVSTDRLAFYRIAANAQDSAYGPAREAPVGLPDLPLVVFSELMRHCDLFTAIASIAADPNWRDRGAMAAQPNQWRAAADDYWTRASFAELSASGQVRRAMLERLLPRLAFGALCTLDERALIVQGKWNRYRIHLGSAAVQIAATNQHVCIVPKATTADGIRLPFTGDTTLSLIVSKAALLVRDDLIKDQIILRQIMPHC